MHYYQFNIGDYASHTRHLSDLEDLAYRRLLDAYYLQERPLNECSTSVARQINMRANEEAVKTILNEFFELTEGGWIHHRADREIEKYRSKVEQASRAGKASAERQFNDRLTDVQPTINQDPITNNQEPIKRVEKQRGTRLPANWEPSDEDIAYCKKERPDLQWQRVAENFRDYWLAQAGSKAVKMDWSRVWKTWVRNEKGARTYESAKDAGRRKVAEAILGKVSHDDRIIDLN